ncbi:MAG: hypothetical protein JNL74_22455, partial [Fibrobacteres bacterium]|nr:hypothetical protein [Fibrobacterota bacterium]
SSTSLFSLGVGIKADYYFRRRGYIRNSKLTKISLSSLRFDLELSNTNVTTPKELDKGTFALLKLSYSMSLFSPSKTHLFSTVTPLQSRLITREFVNLPEDTTKPNSPSKFRPFITTVSAVVAIAAAAYGYGFNKECEEKLAAYKSAQGEAATANAWHDFTLTETKRNTSYSIAAWSLSVCLISLTF